MAVAKHSRQVCTMWHCTFLEICNGDEEARTEFVLVIVLVIVLAAGPARRRRRRPFGLLRAACVS